MIEEEEDDFVVLDNEIPDFVRTTAIDKLSQMNKRVRGVPGGTSAGKTFGIIPLLIDYAAKFERREISIVSESIPHLRKGCIKDFIKIMKATKRWRDERWQKALLRYEFANGSYIEFFSVDQPDKMRGARRHVLYVNECNNVAWSAYHQMAVRTSEFIWLDFNPDHEFWYHTRLVGDDDFEELVLTYLDNEAAPEAAVKEILKAKEKADAGDPWWQNWYKVYGLGQLGALEGVVFSNWKIIDHIPDEYKFIGQGLDFGYTNDPTAVIEVYAHRQDRFKRLVKEVCYSTGLLNKDIHPYLRGRVIADSAEPKSIDELWNMGAEVYGATKGADSIMYGIQTMQRADYLVTEDSYNLIKELRNYRWDTKKDESFANKPVDKWNHGIDAWRYHEMEDLGIDNTYYVF